ncbi:aminotransferase class V-fold PLP-dependent enzyme [Grimontia marina]|uniref:Putative cysteine desulfurase n=1 Tax=Grimontia marina TaxID=646534 RepID=A0A128F0I4_9GAMM|nr:aminotransferase class V-fold PLP-dependent enzyme [Grimontia marina]CZF80055.1 putative cysteine desulfurase [Grimontia marina]
MAAFDGHVESEFQYLDTQGANFLDNAATTFKPISLITGLSEYYKNNVGPVHRTTYRRGHFCSERYDACRANLAEFLGASSDEIIYTRSATESINLVAKAWLPSHLGPGKKVWISEFEHNSNFLPWRDICEKTGSELRYIPACINGELDIAHEDIWSSDSVLIAIPHVSNVIGGEFPIKELCQKARTLGIATLVDASQSASYLDLDVREIQCDFLCFSAHKMYGPEGIGVLFASRDKLSAMTPHFMGGGVVNTVSRSSKDIVFKEGSTAFEAGSPNLAGAIGLDLALTFIQGVGKAQIKKYLYDLEAKTRQRLLEIKEVKVLPRGGNASGSSILSFTIDGVHPHDFADVADRNEQISVRTGAHCAHLLLEKFEQHAVIRVSFAIYNHESVIDGLQAAVSEAIALYGRKNG